MVPTLSTVSLNQIFVRFALSILFFEAGFLHKDETFTWCICWVLFTGCIWVHLPPKKTHCY